MMLSQLPKTKNSQTAWLLAVVLFFSGLSFSSPAVHSGDGKVKARTELVLSARKQATKANSTIKAFSPQEVGAPSAKFTNSIESFGALSALQLGAANKTHRHFSSALRNAAFLSQQTASLPFLIA